MGRRLVLTLILAVLAAFAALTVTAANGLAAEQPLARYDINQNNRLNNPEFFRIVDDWLVGVVHNETIFAAIDLWLGSAPISEAPVITPDPKPTPQQPTCPAKSRLVAMRNGIPYSTYEHMAPDAGLGPVIDIAFRDAVFLPKGANINLTITSDTQGLEPRAGAFRQPVQYGNFYNLGPSQIAGTGSVRDGTLVQAQYEWASFAPYWEDYASTGMITFEAQITASGCPNVRMSGKINIRKVVAALDSDKLLIQHSPFGSTLSMASGEFVRVTLFDASGRVLYQSQFADHVSLSELAVQKRLARGIYLIKIIASVDGLALNASHLKILVVN